MDNERIKNLEIQMRQVQEHIETTNTELGGVKIGVEWLTWAVRWIIGISATTLAGLLINLLIQIIKNK